jgi:phosphoribosylamine--glycine ligase
LPLADFDFADLCAAILDGTLGDFPLTWKSGAVCALVAVAAGYPGAYRKGDPITVNKQALAKTGARLFFAGANAQRDTDAQRDSPATQNGGDDVTNTGLRTSGGRVLAASAWGADPEEARTRAYEALGVVGFAGMAYRTDIGRDIRGNRDVT